MPPIASDGADLVEQVMAALLEASPAPSDAAVAAACAVHPQLAADLTARVAFLRAAGPRSVAGRVPQRLGDYELGDQLGGGGMGVVYRARECSTGREVAIKLIRPDQLWFGGARARFRREIEAVVALSHPGIVTVLSVGEVDDVPFFTMERVEGRSLAVALGELRGRAPSSLAAGALASSRQRNHVDACVALALQVAEALAHAHGRGVVHRDIKPSNVMLASDGRARVIDFGLAHVAAADSMTRSGAQPGSLAYMSPEQLRGEGIDARTDVWSLGALLYEMLTLSSPFLCATETATRAAILAAAPAPVQRANPRVAADLAAVIATALAPERARRYATMAAFAGDLRAYLERRPVAARRPGLLLRTRRSVQRHPARAAGSVAIALLAILPAALLVQERAARTAIEYEAERARRAELQSRTDADTAWQVVAFLEDLFRDAAPQFSQGRTLTLRDALQRGIQMVRGGLQDAPVVRARLLEAMARACLYTGWPGEAADLLAEAETLYAAGPSPTPGATLDRDWLRVSLLLDQGSYDEAERVLRRILASEDCGDRAVVVALARPALADVVNRLGRSEEARELYASGIPRLRAMLPPFDPRLAIPLGNHAMFVTQVNGFQAAEPLFAELAALADRLPAWHPQRLSTLYSLVVHRDFVGDHEQAEQLVQRALADADAGQLDQRHPLRGLLLGRSAWHQLLFDRPKQALALADQALALLQAARSEPHSSAVHVLAVAAVAACQLGDFRRAQQLGKESLAMAMQLPESNRPWLPMALQALGESAVGLGHAEDACTHFEQALLAGRGQKTLQPDWEPFTLAALARAQASVGRGEAARATADQACGLLEGRRDRAGKVQSLANLAWTYTRLGDAVLGEAFAQQALASAGQCGADTRRETAWAWKTLGWAQSRQQRHAEASASFAQSLATYRACLPEEPQVWLNTLELLAKALECDWRFEAAAAQYRQAVAIGERLHGVEHPSLVPMLVNLAYTQERLGQPADAEASIDRALGVLAGSDRVAPANAAATVARALEIAEAVTDPARQRIRLEALAKVAGQRLPAGHDLRARIAKALASP